MIEDPCPACDPCINEAYSYIFNALNRWGEGSMLERLWDAKDYPIPDPELDHSMLYEYVRVARKVLETVDACVVLNGRNFEWMPGTFERLDLMGDELKDAVAAVSIALDAHHEDKRHLGRDINVLRERRGSEHSLWGRRAGDTSYNHFVLPGNSGGPQPRWDLECAQCGSAYLIADYFKDKLREDPDYYAQFYCHGCRATVPWAEININL